MFAIALVLALVSIGLSVVGDLIQPRPRTPRPNIAGIDPPVARQGTPIPVVFGTQRLSPNIVWWGNARYKAITGGFKYGFDFVGVFAMAVDKVWDIVYDTKSVVQYSRPRTYISGATGAQVTGPPLVTLPGTTTAGTTGAQLPFLQTDYAAGPATIMVNAPKLFGGPTSEGGIDQSWMDIFLGGPSQLASAQFAGLIGNAQGGPAAAPIPQPNYPSLCYMVAYAGDASSATPIIGGSTILDPTGTNVGNGTFSAITTRPVTTTQTVTVTLTSATAFTVVASLPLQSLGSGTVGTPFVSPMISFTLSAGGTPFVSGDYFTFILSPGATGGGPSANSDSGYFGTSPFPKPFSLVLSRYPKALSTLIGTDYSVLSTYDANPIECIYDLLTSAYWPAGLTPLLNIDPAKIDVASFKTACQTVYTEADLGTDPGVPYYSTANGGNKGFGFFSDIAGGTGPVETITVTITSVSGTTGDFSVVGSISGAIGTGSSATLFTSAEISFLLANTAIDAAVYVVGDSWTFVMTLIAGAGVSFAVGKDDSSAAEEAIRDLLALVDGLLFEHPETGLITIALARGGYLLGSQPLIDESNARDMDYSETSWPDTYNEVSVRYQDRGVDNSALVQIAGDAWTMKQGVATIQNGASLAASGGVPRLAEPLDYPQISNGLAAAVVAQRALRIVSVPRSRLSCKVNRFAHALTPGSVFRFSWAAHGIDSRAMRVASVDYGTLEEGQITITATSDVYATAPPLLPPGTFRRTTIPPPPIAPTTVSLMTLSPATATIEVNQALPLTVANAVGAVTFTEVDDTIATVSGAAVVRGVAVGSTAVIATDSAGNTARMIVTVVAASATAVSWTITPSALSIPVGGKQTFVATARDASGNIVADTWTYSVSNADGTVDASSGAFQALLAGTLNVIATDGTNTVMAAVTVTALVTGGKSVQIATGDYLGATVTGLMSPTHVSLRARFIGGGSAAGNIGVMTVCNPPGTKWAVDVGYNITGTTVTFFGACQNAAPVALFAIDESDLPVPGTALTIAAQYDAATGGAIALEDDYGTVYGTPWTAANGAAGCGSGAVDATVTDVGIGISVASGSAVLAQGFICSGVQLTDAALIAVAGIPAVADPGNLAIWNFDGSDLTEASAGPSLVLSGGSATYVDDVGPYFWGSGTGTPAPDAIVVSPSEITLDPGDTFTPTFGAFDQYGRPIADTITATSADPTTGTVDGGTPTSGLIVAIKAGTVVVTFTDGTRTGTITVTVNAPGGVPATLSVSPSSAVGIVGGTVKFTATAKDSTGKVVPDPVTWASSDSTNAPVDTKGLVTCKAAGSYTITADDGTLTPATAALTVSTRTTGGGGSSAFEAGTHVNAAYLTNTTDIANLIALAPATHSRVCRDVCLPHHIATSSTGRNWTFMDAAVDAYVAAGIEPYFTIAFWPEWLSGSSDPSVAPSDFAAAVTWYAGFVGEVVTKYKGRVSRWEFWNEPNEGGEGQWVNPNVNNYVTLNNACRKAAKAADPTCQWIMGGGVTGLTATEAAWIGIPFLKNMIALGCQGDALSIHVYPPGDPLVDNSPTLNSGAPDILRVQQILLAAGLNIPLHVTEFGWSDASSNATYGTYITELLQWMQENQTGLSTVSGGTFTSGFGRIELATLFMLKDQSPFSYGLDDSSGSPKTAQFSAFVAFCESIGQ